MTLDDLLEQVDGPDTFLEFARALVADREPEEGQTTDPWGRGVNGWENHSIAEFLAAAIRWAEDSDFGERQDLKNASPWKKAAVFLHCGKIYE